MVLYNLNSNHYLYMDIKYTSRRSIYFKYQVMNDPRATELLVLQLFHLVKSLFNQVGLKMECPVSTTDLQLRLRTTISLVRKVIRTLKNKAHQDCHKIETPLLDTQVAQPQIESDGNHQPMVGNIAVIKPLVVGKKPVLLGQTPKQTAWKSLRTSIMH